MAYLACEVTEAAGADIMAVDTTGGRLSASPDLAFSAGMAGGMVAGGMVAGGMIVAGDEDPSLEVPTHRWRWRHIDLCLGSPSPWGAPTTSSRPPTGCLGGWLAWSSCHLVGSMPCASIDSLGGHVGVDPPGGCGRGAKEEAEATTVEGLLMASDRLAVVYAATGTRDGLVVSGMR
jgi:hypothetical protein